MFSSGSLIYDPQSLSVPTPGLWWLILECSPDLGRYYRQMVFKYTGQKLQKPAWDTHISVVRGEEPLKKELWGRKEIVEFSYDPKLLTNDEYYWLEVKCDRLLDIREELGLPRIPKIGLHLTIGRKIGEFF